MRSNDNIDASRPSCISRGKEQIDDEMQNLGAVPPRLEYARVYVAA
jgi:hypothetical protein